MTSAAIEDEERSLTALYTRRQDLLKDLTETDNQIKALEQKQMQRQQQIVQQRQAVLAMSTGDHDLDSIRDIIEKATHDQSGLREAQKALEAACRIERVAEESDEAYAKRRRYRNMFVWQVIERAKELMVDPNGNYFMQRALSLFKNNGTRSPDGNDLSYDVTQDTSLSEIIALLDRLGPDISEVACNMHGTRAVQRIIDSLVSIEEFELFCDLVANDLVMLIKDLNGNHSISRLLVSQSFMQLGEQALLPAVDGTGLVPDESVREKGQNVRKDVYHVVAANCVEICRNRQGCCIIQRCLQWAPEPFRTEIINAALLNSLKLVQDPFGNYVVQYILDLQQQLVQNNPAEAETLNYTNRIIRQILHNVALLSCNKFSSNVIEKCLRTSSPDVRQLLIDELTDPHALPKLLTDSFANYVIQTAIASATDDLQFAQLRDAIQPLQHLLKNSPYGVKIEAKLLKRHRDAAKKMSRQMRQQRESTRGTPSHQQQGGSGGSSTSHTPTGAGAMMGTHGGSSRQQIRHTQQQLQPFTHADFSNIAVQQQQQQQLVMLQQGAISQQQSGRAVPNAAQPSQNFIQVTQAPQAASFMQLFAAPQQAQGSQGQTQQGAVQFMMASQMVQQHPTSQQQQQQPFIAMALPQQQQQQQQQQQSQPTNNGGWAVSSQGAYALPSQSQQRGNRSPATHSPYTTFSGPF